MDAEGGLSSPEVVELMSACMFEDPTKRPAFDQILDVLEKTQPKSHKERRQTLQQVLGNNPSFAASYASGCNSARGIGLGTTPRLKCGSHDECSGRARKINTCPSALCCQLFSSC